MPRSFRGGRRLLPAAAARPAPLPRGPAPQRRGLGWGRPHEEPGCESCDSGPPDAGDGRGSGPGLRREEAGDNAYDLAMSNIRPEQREGDEQQREERE